MSPSILWFYEPPPFRVLFVWFVVKKNNPPKGISPPFRVVRGNKSPPRKYKHPPPVRVISCGPWKKSPRGNLNPLPPVSCFIRVVRG